MSDRLGWWVNFVDERLWRLGLVTVRRHQKLIDYQAEQIQNLQRLVKVEAERSDAAVSALATQKALWEDLKGLLLLREDQLTAKTLEYETLKNKIVERAKTPPIIKAKSAAEIRRAMEVQNAHEMEESANGI